MIGLLRPDQPKTTEVAPAMDDSTGILPGLPSVAGKPVHVAFDGGRMTSDAGILLLAAVEQRLGIADRLANCLEDPRATGAGSARFGRDDPLLSRAPSMSIPLSYGPVADVLLLSGVGAWPPPDGVG